jgi:hypothetical protein
LAKAKVGQEGGMDKDAFAAAVKKINAKKTTNTINLIKAIVDSITAAQGCGYPKKFLGFDFNDGLCGAGGFTSAYLTIWTMWK